MYKCIPIGEFFQIIYICPFPPLEGHILGVLPVIGLSSGPNATIRLRLVQGRDAIRLNPMSKQMELRKELDREQVEPERKRQ